MNKEIDNCRTYMSEVDGLSEDRLTGAKKRSLRDLFNSDLDALTELRTTLENREADSETLEAALARSSGITSSFKGQERYWKKLKTEVAK